MIKRTLEVTKSNSNNKYSSFYDPMYTMKITINGQLSLSMLIEKIVDRCDAKLLMANTDGFEIYISNEMIDKTNKLVKLWEDITGLQMEQVEYESMFIRDVNSYIAVTTDGKIKRKGAYTYHPAISDKAELGFHQNHSSLIIPMAVEHEVLGLDKVEDFIMNHKDPFDFLLSTKVPRPSRLVLVNEEGEDIPLQNICRYYPSTTKGKLVKIMPPLEVGGDDRRLGIMTDWDVKVCNNMDNFTWDINYDYYVSEAKKLLEPFENLIY